MTKLNIFKFDDSKKLSLTEIAKQRTLHRIIYITILGALAWGVLFLLLDKYIESIYPLAFFLLLGIYYIFKNKFVSNRTLSLIYITAIFILPFALQIQMGGTYNSGFVGIWSLLSPLAALLFLKYKFALRVFILFLLFSGIVIFLEVTIQKPYFFNDIKTLNFVFLIINILTVSSLCFLTLSYFTAQLIKSKDLISDKDESLNTGLDYAKTVQMSLINSNLTELSKHLNYFIFCKPMNVVCGDFFWSRLKDNNIYIAVVDCSGHGVPAAFLSILGSTLLDDLILKNNLTDPAEILTKLNIELRKKQNPNSNKFKDCFMDMTLLKMDRISKTIEYSCANTTFQILEEGKNVIFKSESMALGKDEQSVFHTSTLNYIENSTIYLSSNGVKNQKNNSNQPLSDDSLGTIYKEVNTIPMAVRENKLNTELKNWMDNDTFNDDILVVGIKLNF